MVKKLTAYHSSYESFSQVNANPSQLESLALQLHVQQLFGLTFGTGLSSSMVCTHPWNTMLDKSLTAQSQESH